VAAERLEELEHALVRAAALAKVWVYGGRSARTRARMRGSNDDTITSSSGVTSSNRHTARDSLRRVAPLAAAPDAVIIDTTRLDADQVFERAAEIIARALATHSR